MAVHVDISRCDNIDELWVDGPQGREMAPVTKWLGITLCLHTGMDEINAGNEQEVYARLWLIQQVYGGAFMVEYDATGKPVDRPFTMADVRRHRGMRVNTSRQAPATFMARVRRAALDRAQTQAEALDRRERVQAQEAEVTSTTS